MVTTQVPVPVQAPAQPLKVEPDFAVAVRVTTVPGANLCVQLDPHEIPAGLLLIVPLPVPGLGDGEDLWHGKLRLRHACAPSS